MVSSSVKLRVWICAKRSLRNPAADPMAALAAKNCAVKLQIIDNHVGAENISFSGYNKDTPLNTVLLVPAPYDEVYLRWMEAQIDYHNGEYDKFNNSIVMYNTAFDNYQKCYIRTHKPVQTGRRFLF